MRKMTIYEIAKKSGVSIATISRAVNPETQHKVAAQTLGKIERLIAQHNYTPNRAASQLTRARYMTVGVLIPHHAGILLEPYYSKILCGVADALLDTDYKMKIVMLKCQKPKWDKYNFQIGEGIDALIVTHWHAFFSGGSSLENMKIPCVVLNDVENGVKAHFIAGDHYQGGRMVADYLFNEGHRRFAVMTGPKGSSDSHMRLKGFRDGLSKKRIKLEPHQIMCGEFQEQKAADITEDLLQANPKATALFCLNDGMALGVLRRLKELKVDCPKKISVVGYDNDSRGELSLPALSSVQVPLYGMAHAAAKQLAEYLVNAESKKSKNSLAGRILLPVELVKRKSVRQVR